MEKTVFKDFSIDGDTCKVKFTYDIESKKYIGEYPDFEQTSRCTPGGSPWVNATQDGCQYADNRYYPEKSCTDCGSCRYYLTENVGDLIGICSHQLMRR